LIVCTITILLFFYRRFYCSHNQLVLGCLRLLYLFSFFFFEQKKAYDRVMCLEFRRVLFRPDLGSAAVKAGLAKSKFTKQAGFGEKIVGHIMLTYHQDDCWYRNIKIRELQ